MKWETEFTDKVVVVTGASAGLGRSIAREFGKQKAKVVLLARGMDGLLAAQKEIESMGGKALPVKVDVADPEQVENAATLAEKTFGPIDVWVNNAMNSVFAPVKDVTPAEIKRITEVTYLGQVYGTMSALKRMRLRDKGSIVLVGSALAYRGIPLQSAYCGSKHAVQGFFDSLKTELLHEKSNIKLSMVQLPAMNTTQFGWVLSKLPNKPRPMGKIYQPEVAARAIVFTAATRRRGFWVGYTTYEAILGNRLLPWYADWVLSRNGYKGQQTNEPVSPDRKNNVWTPVPGDHGAHGPFDSLSHNRSFTVWLSMNRGLAVFVGIVLLAILLILIF
ncbi:MAG TPA: SDR family oxidoreductase [Bacteroidales bacterium]|nr:SDR family oxidoreductase [Bacteroidales bacterium]